MLELAQGAQSAAPSDLCSLDTILLCLVIAKPMIALSHSRRRQVLLLHFQLLLVFSLVFYLVSEFAFLLNFLLFCPLFSLAPFATMLVVVPVVLKTSLACSFELFEVTTVFAGCVLG
jgi:hypothetical protein